MNSSLSNIPTETEAWPEALDALVASCAHHTLLFENEQVRVVQTRIPAGQSTAVHTHRWPCVMFIQTWSDIIRRDAEGNITLDTRQLVDKPEAHHPTWQTPLSAHAVENVGGREFHAIQVEIKGAG